MSSRSDISAFTHRHPTRAHQPLDGRPGMQGGQAPCPGTGRAAPAGAAAADRAEPDLLGPEVDPHLDGLFTYCLSLLRDHAAATDALAAALRAAARGRARRTPEAGGRRARLYALARWACLQSLAGAWCARPDGSGGDAYAGRRRERELAVLTWPEVSGAAPEQREALDLTVRHRLSAPEVAAVLGLAVGAARELIASAACEVERIRTAVSAVELSGCPAAAGFTAGEQPPGALLHRRLVQHVDDCPRCRRTAERIVPEAWPGTSVLAPGFDPTALPLVVAPRTAVRRALRAAGRPVRHGAPRLDRRGYPVGARDRARHRYRIRASATTAAFVATVIAAPLLSLWSAAHGERAAAPAGRPVAIAVDRWAAAPGRTQDSARRTDGGRTPAAHPGAPHPAPADTTPPARSAPAHGRLTVRAAAVRGATVLRLTATGATVRWTVSLGGTRWLHASRTSGALRPGATTAVYVYADHAREPEGPWTARVTVEPSGTLVPVTGGGYPEPDGTRDTRWGAGRAPARRDRDGYGSHDRGDRTYGAPRWGGEAAW